MAVKWTDEQQSAIDLRDRSILVSAAAGSGKTAVLIERVTKRITADANPIDVDQLLVVTFTRAAAWQMQERLQEALQKCVDAHPEEARYREQLALVPYAMISTIDSFCKNIVMDHFQNCPDLDPGFRIADEGECKLLKGEMLQKVIKEAYEKQPEGFDILTKCFSNTSGDDRIADMILKLDQFANSAPWPVEWLEACKEAYQLQSEEELKASKWYQFAKTDIMNTLEGYIADYEALIDLATEMEVGDKFLEVIREDLEKLHALMAIDSTKHEERMTQAASIKFGSKPRYSTKVVCSEETYNAFAETRKAAKDAIANLVKKFNVSCEEIIAENQLTGTYATALIDLAIQFISEYSAAKRRKNIVDFGDLEHFALNILVKEHRFVDGVIELEVSDVAKRYQKQYREVMVDEYQDSNLVQECILLAVSGNLSHAPNLFMVGDVKQSIYKFRMAKSALFMQKYDSYTTESSPYQKVELNANFRSSEAVIDGINSIFYKLMERNLGGIDYDDQNALYAKRQMPEPLEGECAKEIVDEEGNLIASENGVPAVEIDLLDLAGSDALLTLGEDDETNEQEADEAGEDGARDSFDERKQNDTASEVSIEDITKAEWEARMVAKRILELTDPKTGMWILDGEHYRRARYQDVMIMLRGGSEFVEAYMNTLHDYNIPAICDTSAGYFSMYEVQLLLNLLTIIDNPLQDIPFVSVARSPIGDLTAEDLATIRIFAKQFQNEWNQTGVQTMNSANIHCFYEAMTTYIAHIHSGEVAEKAKRFVERINRYREWNQTDSIHDLLVKILKDTQFEAYAGAMPSGNMRRKNIDMLLQKTMEFERTDYCGLFQFIRYVEQLKKYETELASLPLEDVGAGAVHIMTIHKSKGLEYPICILAGIAKNFNMMDTKAKIIVDDDFKMALACIDAKRKIKVNAFMMEAFKRRILTENLSEEQRILYVAMTRAKDKLILAGSLDRQSVSEYREKMRKKVAKNRELSYTTKTSAKTYLDWIMPAYEIVEREQGSNCPIAFHAVTPAELAFEAADEKENRKQILEEIEANIVADTSFVEVLEKKYQHEYAYSRELTMRANLSVSDIKHQAMEALKASEEDIPYEPLLEQKKQEQQTEKKISQSSSKEANEGALRGTAYHNMFEKIDFTDERVTTEEIATLLDELVTAGAVSKDDRARVNPKKLMYFFQSALGQRMIRAAKRGQLYKEQQFILGLTPKEHQNPGYDATEKELDDCDGFVMVQGIIDAYFIDDDGRLVLMDYKTDRISDGTGESLILNYWTQLRYYAKALARMMRMEVSEWWLYSVNLDRELPVTKECPEGVTLY